MAGRHRPRPRRPPPWLLVAGWWCLAGLLVAGPADCSRADKGATLTPPHAARLVQLKQQVSDEMYGKEKGGRASAARAAATMPPSTRCCLPAKTLTPRSHPQPMCTIFSKRFRLHERGTP